MVWSITEDDSALPRRAYGWVLLWAVGLVCLGVAIALALKG
jgi:hypothetical protein